jgi:hypothetical protein
LTVSPATEEPVRSAKSAARSILQQVTACVEVDAEELRVGLQSMHFESMVEWCE